MALQHFTDWNTKPRREGEVAKGVDEIENDTLSKIYW
jgi:hypothetical protein